MKNNGGFKINLQKGLICLIVTAFILMPAAVCLADEVVAPPQAPTDQPGIDPVKAESRQEAKPSKPNERLFNSLKDMDEDVLDAPSEETDEGNGEQIKNQIINAKYWVTDPALSTPVTGAGGRAAVGIVIGGAAAVGGTKPKPPSQVVPPGKPGTKPSTTPGNHPILKEPRIIPEPVIIKPGQGSGKNVFAPLEDPKEKEKRMKGIFVPEPDPKQKKPIFVPEPDPKKKVDLPIK